MLNDDQSLNDPAVRQAMAGTDAMVNRKPKWAPAAREPRPELTRGQKLFAMFVLAVVIGVALMLAIPVLAYLYHHAVVPLYRWGF